MPFFDLPLSALPQYRSDSLEPPDFDAFWGMTLSEARSEELDPQIDPIDIGLDVFDVFDVSFRGFSGHRIKAWLIRPKHVEVTTCVVKFIGYGGGRDFALQHLTWPAARRAVLVMDTRGQGSTWSVGVTPDPVGSDSSHPGFMTKGILDPYTYYYRRLITDGVRAVEAARTMPEIDPNQVFVSGFSQGGGIALAVAALHRGVAGLMCDVPFLCDFPRATGLTAKDPYGEIAKFLTVHRDKVDIAYRTLSYFDGVHFATRAKCPALFSVGLMDDVCPPSTVYGAYNGYAGEKSIEVYRFNNHEGGGTLHELRQIQWLAALS